MKLMQGRSLAVLIHRIFLLLMLALLSGCMQPQFVDKPYPRWGKEFQVSGSTDTGEEATPSQSLLLRVMSPPTENPPVGCLLLVHGMNEHIGRYEDVAHFFSQQFMVAGFDYYAHGLSNPVLQQADRALSDGAGRQDVSDAYLAQTPLDDLAPMRRDLDRAIIETVRICDMQYKKNKPVFIVAHSLGALVTASYMLQPQAADGPVSRIAGVVFLGPGFAVSEVPGWRGWLANPLIKLSFHAETHFLHPHDEPLPVLIFNQLVSLLTVPVLDGMFEVLSWPGIRRFATPSAPGWVVDYLTDSAQEKASLREDGWIIRRSLLRYVKGIESEIVQFRRHMDGFSTPYFLIYSAHDPITPAWGSKDFIHATIHNHPDNAYRALSQSRYHQHLFLTEPLRSRLLHDIEQWLNKRVETLQQKEK